LKGEEVANISMVSSPSSSMVNVIRGGVVMVERGAQGSTFMGVMFITTTETPQEIQVHQMMMDDDNDR